MIANQLYLNLKKKKRKEGLAAPSPPWGGVVSRVPSAFPEGPRPPFFHHVQRLWVSVAAIHSTLHCLFLILSRTPPCGAFVGLGGLYSSRSLSSKMLPYGRLFLNISSVVNCLKAPLHEDSRLFHCGCQTREPAGLLGGPSLRDSTGGPPILHRLTTQGSPSTRWGSAPGTPRNGRRKKILQNTPPKWNEKTESRHLVAKETHPEGAASRRPKKTRSRKAGRPYLTLPSSQGRRVLSSVLYS